MVLPSYGSPLSGVSALSHSAWASLSGADRARYAVQRSPPDLLPPPRLAAVAGPCVYLLLPDWHCQLPASLALLTCTLDWLLCMAAPLVRCSAIAFTLVSFVKRVPCVGISLQHGVFLSITLCPTALGGGVHWFGEMFSTETVLLS